jgi:hypothetical protein
MKHHKTHNNCLCFLLLHKNKKFPFIWGFISFVVCVLWALFIVMFCDFICIVFFFFTFPFFLFCLVVSCSLWCYFYLMFLHDIVVYCFGGTFTWCSPAQHCYSFLCSTLRLMFIVQFEVPSSYSSTCLTCFFILFLVNATCPSTKWS